MGGRVMKPFGHVMPFADDPTPASDHSPYRDLALVKCGVGFFQGFGHVFLINVHGTDKYKKSRPCVDLPKESCDFYHLSSDDTVSFLRP